MRRVVVVVLLACSAVAHADPPHVLPPLEPPPTISPLKTTPEASLSPLRLDSVDLDRIEHRARTRRNIGIGLAIPGVTMIVLGAVLMGFGGGQPTTKLNNAAIEIATGAVSSAVGLVFTIPGALLWVGGQDSLDTAAWRRKRPVQ
ncbi:MAG: hypothetical protein ABI321_11555 [Polyangia bacterium]